MKKSWELYAHHILDCIDQLRVIQKRGEIKLDRVLYDSALRNLQTLSEATRHLPEAYKARYTDISWNKISGFRNILVHDYLGEIDHETIDKVISTQLLPLENAVKDMLSHKS